MTVSSLIPHHHRSRRGFTLIELIVAISIILVLIGMLFLGFKMIGGSSKANATKLTLENAKSMMAEFEGAAGFGRQPENWYWGAPNTFVGGDIATQRLNFWRVPERTGVDDTGDAIPLATPGNVEFGSPDRNTHWAIRNTQLGMGLMQAVAANRSAVGRLAPDQLFVPLWDGSLTYEVGNTVSHGGATYRAGQPSTGSTPVPNPPPPPPANDWEITGTMSIMMQDAWGNPIILVPASGLTGVTIGSNANQTIVAAGNRPFFASAGPDGNFQAGDDNVYSFEN